MRKHVLTLVILMLLFVSSCDNRSDYFIDVNQKPLLSIYKDGVEIKEGPIVDSIKIGNPYGLQYHINDEENLALNNTQEQGVNEVIIKNENVTINGLNEGMSRIRLWTKDSFGTTGEYQVNLTVFRNLIPVAKMITTKIAVSSPNEYEIDASASFDGDKRFGGSIVEYEYTLQNYVITTPLSKIRYIFGSVGQKKISLRVKDNSGDYSKTIYEYIVLE